ncbi:MAG TPA: hypothetical protein VLH19_02040 [Patescibacteria group bacterium]|nr:hypothetical protein [Patescibacteria group bacterium]
MANHETVQLNPEQQQVVYELLRTYLPHITKLERGGFPDDGHNEVVRALFIILARSLGKLGELSTSDKLRKGLTDLLTDDELLVLIKKQGKYQELAKELLRQRGINL